jgi:hypothetical protein
LAGIGPNSYLLTANPEIKIIKNQDRTFLYEIHEKSVHINDAKRARNKMDHPQVFVSFLPIPSPL